MTDDPLEWLETVRAAQAGAEYSAVERYHDFHSVFEGPRGKRVLEQIIARGNGPIEKEGDCAVHSGMAFRAGLRFLAAWVAATAAVPPPAEVKVEKPGPHDRWRASKKESA